MTNPTVDVFIDYQNLHLSAGEAFVVPGMPPHTYLIHPAKFADVLMKRRQIYGRGGTVQNIYVYRGQPSSAKEPRQAARNKAQKAEWERDRRVKVATRALRYPQNWPTDKAKEKGVDVKLAIDFARCALTTNTDTLILASRDTDLVPALEMALDLGKAHIEVAGWSNTSRLRIPGKQLWSTSLSGAEFTACKDPRQY
ncbi:NYN domain-containing protein [Mycobacterium sp. 852014-52450_SCH5900713]|uniref:NYN domain-containing protein n=1 Tax=Mycobacterium sp. 852014-52450_SCH5900713 TaxID=1834116 RepID=UPI0009EECDCC|nr:NYN domain-containing protein [Mycobacterium sp. 852014-52450_SCH5900713]